MTALTAMGASGLVFPSAFLKPRRSVLAVERQAARTIERCHRKLQLDEIPLPIPVEEWIEQAMRIRFSVMDLSYLGPGVLGGAFLTKREIVVDQSLCDHLGRYRFTCAHELGHMVMHRKFATALQDREATGAASAPPSEKLEWQADRFAAAFLMPAELLVRELFQACEKHQLDARRAIAELMMDTPESDWLWRYRFLPYLTKRFEVSLSALLLRFGDLRLPDGKPFLLQTSLDRLFLRSEEADAARAFLIQNGFPTKPPRLFGVP